MATRSQIAMVLPDGKIMSIYCHNDGYLSWVGKILGNYYTNEQKVLALMRLGNLSALAPEIGEQHSFYSHYNWCAAYGRDRGESDHDAVILNNRNDLCQWAAEQDAEFIYLFKNDSWTYRPIRGKRFRRLNVEPLDVA